LQSTGNYLLQIYLISFYVSASAISQHLKVLREANLVEMEKQAQKRIYQINPDAIYEIEEWVKKMTELWNQRFDALDEVLKIEKEKLLQIQSASSQPVKRKKG
jgi:DNA-binding transcriptional ArsR family regulator